MKFKYCFELKEGYEPVPSFTQEEAETEVRFVVEARNRVTADRAVKALLKGAVNIESFISGVCIEG